MHGLASTFYDLKQTLAKTSANMQPGLSGNILVDFVKKRWTTSLLSKYFKALDPIYATRIWKTFFPAPP